MYSKERLSLAVSTNGSNRFLLALPVGKFPPCRGSVSSDSGLAVPPMGAHALGQRECPLVSRVTNAVAEHCQVLGPRFVYVVLGTIPVPSRVRSATA
jgi:hypothetical protein